MTTNGLLFFLCALGFAWVMLAFFRWASRCSEEQRQEEAKFLAAATIVTPGADGNMLTIVREIPATTNATDKQGS